MMTCAAMLAEPSSCMCKFKAAASRVSSSSVAPRKSEGGKKTVGKCVVEWGFGRATGYSRIEPRAVAVRARLSGRGGWRHSLGTRHRPTWCATMTAPTDRPSRVEWAMGIRDRPISPRSPWQNPCVERLIGTLRRSLDHVLIFGERNLRHVLTLYSLYYNETRTHLGLSKDAPLRRAIQQSRTIVTTPI